ncbi:MAG: family 43 glycosylhydrolase, partial [Clostridiales bacterium]|nr:family 43 glycosylhydrolase [Clostridiales bacterium]
MGYKRILAALLTGAMVLGLCSCASSTDSSEDGTQSAAAESEATEETESQAALLDGEVALELSSFTNPIAGFDEDGDITYGGDPSVLVDGDTVYLYLGHDTSTDDSYVMLDYICYSSTDLVNWTYEGSVFTASKALVEWLNTSTSAWAAQVVKHYDEDAGKDMYYLYYCSWDATSDGKQSIGVAVSDSPTGVFEDIGEPLVSGNVTIDDETSTWNDIDPTVWIETDEDGEEHRYLAWGNGRCYVCELNEDMVSVKDQNGDGEITSGASTDVADIIESTDGLTSYTEAPWLYRRQDEDGNYYGDYYLFYAYSWRECLAYATTDDLLNGSWTFGSVIMRNSATANTEHPAVFDFQGKTYLISHNGALAGGDGYRRSPIILEIEWNDDGTIDLMKELTASIAGTASTITLADGSTVG